MLRVQSVWRWPAWCLVFSLVLLPWTTQASMEDFAALGISVEKGQRVTSLAVGKRTYSLDLRQQQDEPPVVNVQLGKLAFRSVTSVVYVPGLGLVGYRPQCLEERPPAPGDPLSYSRGFVSWIIPDRPKSADVLPGDFIQVAGLHDNGVTAERILLISAREVRAHKGSHAFKAPRKVERMHAYLIERTQLVRQWHDLVPLRGPDDCAIPRAVSGGHLKYGRGGRVQFATAVDGMDFSVTLFGPSLDQPEEYFPVRLAYLMPEKIINYGDLWSLRKQDPESLHKKLLVPNADLPGLYGFLEADGVRIPEGSLGVLPISTLDYQTEMVRGVLKRKREYLLTHAFLIAYPDGDQVVWRLNTGPHIDIDNGDRFVHWELVKNNRLYNLKRADVFPFLIVAQRADGRWDALLPMRATNAPTDLARGAESLEAAMLAGEDALVLIESRLTKRSIEAAAKAREERQKVLAEERMQRMREYDEWRKANPYNRSLAGPSRATSGPIPAAPGRSAQGWSGFSYSAETRNSYNRTIEAGRQRQDMLNYSRQLDYNLRRSY